MQVRVFFKKWFLFLGILVARMAYVGGTSLLSVCVRAQVRKYTVNYVIRTSYISRQIFDTFLRMFIRPEFGVRS